MRCSGSLEEQLGRGFLRQRSDPVCFLILSPSLKHLQSSMPEPGGGETVVGQSTRCLPEGALGDRMFILTTTRTLRDRDTGKDKCRKVDCCAELMVPERNVGAEGWRQCFQRSLSSSFG